MSDKFILICFTLVILCCAGKTKMTELDSCDYDYLSPLALAADREGRTLYIAEHTAKQVAVFDIVKNEIKSVIELPDNPGGLVLSPHETQLYITAGGAEGRVFIYNTYHV